MAVRTATLLCGWWTQVKRSNNLPRLTERPNWRVWLKIPARRASTPAVRTARSRYITCYVLWNTCMFWLINWLLNPLECYFGIEGHIALNRNLGLEYKILLLRLIPGDPLSACSHEQFLTLSGLLDSRAELSHSYPNVCMPSREAVCTIFIMVFGMTRLGCEPATYRMRCGHINH